MTDLEKALAGLRHESPTEGWTATTVSDGHPYPSALAGHVATILNAAVSGELIPATERDAAVAAAGKLADALRDFATAKIDALRYQPAYGESPEDDPDPVVDADYVWALQADAKAALSEWEAADALARVRAEERGSLRNLKVIE